MSMFAIMESKVFYGSSVVTLIMRVGVFLILITLLAPVANAQSVAEAEIIECTPSELSFGVNNAFVRSMTDGAEDASAQWLVYMPAMCGQTVDRFYETLPIDVDSFEQPKHIPGSFILSLEQPLDIRKELLSTDEVVRFSIVRTHANEPRFIPNDPSFSSQWHLQNTGQGSGTPGEDANVTGAWDSVKGSGVLISVVDDGVDHQHSDLSPNYQDTIDWDYCGNDGNPTPTSNDGHGTSAAGVAAGIGDNNYGISGAAMDADLIGIRLIACSNDDQDEADAIGHRRDVVAISSNSWGPSDSGNVVSGPEPLLQASLEDNMYQGRGGLGTIVTLAGGNGRNNGDNSNYDGYANSRFTIGVAAITDYGDQAWYSEDGANLLVAAHSRGGAQGITTADIRGSGGYTSTDINNNFGGTSSATPLVSGVIALMLEANPTLTYRDVQHVLVHSARTNDASDSDWVTNGAGHDVNHKYGHGAIDAGLAVHIARNWTNVNPEFNWSSGELDVSQSIPDNTRNGLSETVTVDAGLLVESVEIRFDADHTYRGDLEITLTSPDGTESRLAEEHNDNNNNFNEWVFSTVLHWDESSDGDWTLDVNDRGNGYTGSWNHWELVIHGAEEIIDSDNDGLPDEDETNIHNTDPLDPDSDDDNLMDGYEIFNSSTSPIDSDTDDDLLDDGQEVLTFLTNPLQEDTDSDGLTDGNEVLVTFSNPLVFDADSDSDGWYWFQDCNDTNPNIKPFQPELLDGIDNNCENGIDEGFEFIDSDNDRLSDWAEFHVQSTDWNNPDTDGDGMDDGDEVQVFFSDPTYADPDDDSDGYYWFQDCDDNDSDRSPGLSEWLNGIDDDCDEEVDEDFLTTDADRDGLIDVDEYNVYNTEWQDADTDDDGMQDGYELYIGTNPLFADLDNDGDGVRWFLDCDDNNSNINPYAEEIRNGIDDNCDGEIDEGLPALDPQILIVAYSSRISEVNKDIAITAYANTDTEAIVFQFDDPLEAQIFDNRVIVTTTVEGIYRGEVCAITDGIFDCESIVVEFTQVEEQEVTPTITSEPEQRSSYTSELRENLLTIIVLTSIILIIVLLGWKRPKAPTKWQQPSAYDSNVPAAPDLSMWSK